MPDLPTCVLIGLRMFCVVIVVADTTTFADAVRRGCKITLRAAVFHGVGVALLAGLMGWLN